MHGKDEGCVHIKLITVPCQKYHSNSSVPFHWGGFSCYFFYKSTHTHTSTPVLSQLNHFNHFWSQRWWSKEGNMGRSLVRDLSPLIQPFISSVTTHLHGFLGQEICAGGGNGKGAVPNPLYRVVRIGSLHVGWGKGWDFPMHWVCGGVG